METKTPRSTFEILISPSLTPHSTTYNSSSCNCVTRARHTGNSSSRSGAAQQPPPAIAAPCWDPPRIRGPWHECPGLQPDRPAPGRSARLTGACRVRASHGSSENIRDRSGSTTGPIDHRWGGRWRGGAQGPASLGNHSPHGDKNASRCRFDMDVGALEA